MSLTYLKYIFILNINSSWKSSPSPTEIAAIIAQAKQASASVLIAQQQVQAAKDNVLLQQKLASEKESQAAIALQKTEVCRYFIVMLSLSHLRAFFVFFRLLQVMNFVLYFSVSPKIRFISQKPFNDKRVHRLPKQLSWHNKD